MLQARRLHDDVMTGVPADKADRTVFVTLPGQRTNDRNAESAAWAMQVFREANGMSGRDYDGRFLTETQLRERLQSDPDSVDRVVILQDAIGTGTEAFSSAYRGATEVAPNKEVLFGALGATADGYADLRRGGTEFRTGAHNFRPFGDPASIEAVTNPRTRIERMLAGYGDDHPIRGAFSRTTGWDEQDPSSAARLRTGYAFPHMFPNSTPERTREMLRAMGLLGAYSERRVERPAGSRDAAERQSRIHGTPDGEDTPSRFKTIGADAEWMKHIMAEALKHEPTLSFDGQRFAVRRDEPLMIGASDKSDVRVDNIFVSRNHGELRYDVEKREFIYTDHSTNGTYITREDGRQERIKGGETRIGEKDKINLGRPDGPEVQLTLPLAREVARPAAANPLLSPERSNEIFIGNKAVAFTEGQQLQIGRNWELDGAGSRINDLRVSKNHGSLRFDARANSFVYEDHSTNGTYIRRAGSPEFEKVNNRGVKVSPSDEIRLGSPEGPQVEFYTRTGPGSRVDHDRAFFNGRPVDFQGHEAKITFDQVSAERDVINAQVSREHGTLTYDRNRNQYTYTDTSTNGTFLKRAGTNEWIRLHKASEHGDKAIIRAGDELRLGTEHGPELKLAGLRGRRTADGGIEFTNGGNGKSLWKDSTWTHTDGLGITRTEDAAGRIKTGTDVYGRSVTYRYEENSPDLRNARWSDGTELSSTNGRDWVMKMPDGQFQMWSGKVSVERDGALRFDDGHAPPVVRRLDGSSETVYRSGRIEYSDADRSAETQRLNARIDSAFGMPEQRERFRSMMAAFEARGLDQAEVAMTYHHINRMLNAGNESMIPFSERLQLAEQVMLHAANPASIDQGRNKTCNVTTVEHRVFARKPSEAASMLADVSITGKYVTADGKVVDLSRVGGLRPDAESSKPLGAPFNPKSKDHADLKVDGERTWASQIFENVAVNLHWQNIAREKYPYLGPRDVVGYTKVAPNPSNPRDTGERLFRFTYDPRTHVLQREQISDSPKIYAHDLTGVYNHIVGEKKSATTYGAGREQGFVIQAHEFSQQKHPGDATVVKTKEDFVAALQQAQAQGRMPMIAYIHTANAPFGNPSNPGSGGWHVINIQSVQNQGGMLGFGQKTKVEFTNQWGADHDYTGGRAVDSDVIWAAMQGPGGKR
jgi:pSer/pThr/pTyr-binding forkhead associated (FHA) protein